ncbi:helix-turn-helix transcriptional regulator [Undibacterium sp. CY18W]|uniref:Helix-turn-helix transcriptional regulator n=1 Tax=Undibacterium hunanense TaxID=2762292 RepID=A0ABR6ZSV6_9BURK|nr:helix-turn-helix transcriptional regulator [Undibacterium hunanense]MBC3918988.1 helix-turn-helix transcriptional regulator [Undibacterium hunanense]
MCRTEAKPLPLIETARANADGGAVVYAVTSSGQARTTPEHSHARGQMLAAMSGVLVIATEQQHLVVPSGYAIWLPPFHRHALRTSHLFNGWSAYLSDSAALPVETQVFPVSGLLRESVLRAASWSVSDHLSPAQERILAVIVDETAGLPQRDFVLAMPTDRRLLKVASALLETPGDPRSMQEWATWAGIAPRSMTRHFLDETGMSFSDWRQRARLMLALELLAAGTAVTAIALELGYDSLSAFIAMFKRHFGVPPSQFSPENT